MTTNNRRNHLVDDDAFDALSPELPTADVERVQFIVDAEADDEVRLAFEYTDSGTTWVADDTTWIHFSLSHP